MNGRSSLLLHAVVVLAMLAVYAVLVLSGDDGTGILALLAGYIGGAGAQRATERGNDKQ